MTKIKKLSRLITDLLFAGTITLTYIVAGVISKNHAFTKKAETFF